MLLTCAVPPLHAVHPAGGRCAAPAGHDEQGVQRGTLSPGHGFKDLLLDGEEVAPDVARHGGLVSHKGVDDLAQVKGVQLQQVQDGWEHHCRLRSRSGHHEHPSRRSDRDVEHTHQVQDLSTSSRQSNRPETGEVDESNDANLELRNSCSRQDQVTCQMQKGSEVR